MLNIFLIVHDFSGARTYTDELSAFLSDAGHNVYLVYLDSALYNEFTIVQEKNVYELYIPTLKIEYDFRYFQQTLNKYHKQVAKLLFCHYKHLENVIFHSNKYEQFSFVEEVKKLFGCPVIFTLHFLQDFYSYFDKSSYPSEAKDEASFKSIINLSDHIICVTGFAQRAIVNLCYTDSLKTTVIYNGIRVTEKKPFTLKDENIKTMLGFLPEDRLLLYAGPLSERKGIDALIKAFCLLKDEYPNSKLVIAGTGEYDKYFPYAQDLPGRICFTGKLPKEKLILFYQIAEMGIMPSRYEQCSYVVIEMMLHHLPLIISDTPGLNELVANNESGLLCGTYLHSTEKKLEINVNDLANQMRAFLDNPLLAKKLTQNAYENCLKIHSLDSMGNKTLKIYKKILNNQMKEYSKPVNICSE